MRLDLPVSISRLSSDHWTRPPIEDDQVVFWRWHRWINGIRKKLGMTQMFTGLRADSGDGYYRRAPVVQLRPKTRLQAVW